MKNKKTTKLLDNKEEPTKTTITINVMDQPPEPSTSKGKPISDLHFNAISNANSFRSNKSTNDQTKLLPTNQKHVIAPMSQQSPQSNGNHKITNSSSEGPSTNPSSSTSPVLSPITSRPKHHHSTRSLRSGLCSTVTNRFALCQCIYWFMQDQHQQCISKAMQYLVQW